LLLARVAALLLLAAAFARPYVLGTTPGRLRVVAVDRSFSMGGQGRFERALGLALDAVNADADRGDRIAVLAFDDRAEVVAVPGSAADARAAIQTLKPGFGATRYKPVFDKALELAAGAGGRLVIVTDLQRTGWEGDPGAALPPEWELDLRDIGDATVNTGVTSIKVEADRVVASVHNSGTSAQSGRVRAALDGREVSGAPYSVEAGATVDVPILWRAPTSGALAVSIDDPAGLPADNTRYASLESRRTAKALVVSSGGSSGLYFFRALETSAGEDAGFDAIVVQGSRVGSLTDVSSHAVVVLLSTRGLDRKGREALAAYVRSGGGLFVAASPDFDVSVLATIVGGQPPLSAVELRDKRPLTFAATDLRHPIFRPFGGLVANLGQIRFDRAWLVKPEGWQVMARFTDGTPALLERSEGTGRVVLFASDVDRRWNDLPLHPAFVPFAIESARYVASARHQTRDYTVGQAPAGTEPQPGVYRTGSNQQVVTVNVDAREASRARITADSFDSLVQRSVSRSEGAGEVQAQQTEGQQNYWRYGLLLMISALVAESFVGRS
jgi:von Willebrand factor type A domain